MKLSKIVLKGIIKECLVEILAEGLGTTLTEAVNVRRQIKETKLPMQQVNSKNAGLLETVKRAAGKDKQLLDVLADTAATSLQTMIAEDRQTGQDLSHLAVSKQSTLPVEQFDNETVNIWQTLAFAKPKKK